MSRLQHLLCVLQELASHTGHSNRRLAFHGLRALAQHIYPTSVCSSSSAGIPLLPRIYDSSKDHCSNSTRLVPGFLPQQHSKRFDSSNSCRRAGSSRNLHILDIGVSHGVQWPTLLEAFTRRPGGPPSLVRITVIADTIENDQNKETPFSVGTPGDNLSSRLLCFAKSMNVNLQINQLNNHPLQSLSAQAINTSPDETLIVCAQFRLHHLNHNYPDERTELLRVLRGMEPKGVILSENSMDCSCKNCGSFATGFSRRVDYLWRFLDSTSSAFKGWESEERRLMEGEAAKALTNRREMNEGKEKWCERIRGVGFVGKPFGEDAIDGVRALLRKYDSNWEMRAEEKDGCVGLWWKEQPVSFCSLWKLDKKTKDS